VTRRNRLAALATVFGLTLTLVPAAPLGAHPSDDDKYIRTSDGVHVCDWAINNGVWMDNAYLFAYSRSESAACDWVQARRLTWVNAAGQQMVQYSNGRDTWFHAIRIYPPYIGVVSSGHKVWLNLITSYTTLN
jgi:hypothetical protein